MAALAAALSCLQVLADIAIMSSTALILLPELKHADDVLPLGSALHDP
jgi:hypothetical protein